MNNSFPKLKKSVQENVNSASQLHLESDNYATVVKRNPKRVTVVGKNYDSNIGNNKIEGVPKIISLHVYRLPPSTKSEDVLNFLKPKFPEAKCEPLSSRNPDLYSSFKVDIFINNFDLAMDPNIWPSNVCVRRFLHLRQKTLIKK